MWPGPHPEASEAPGRHRPASFPRRHGVTDPRVWRILAVWVFAALLVVQIPGDVARPSASRPDHDRILLTFRTDAPASAVDSAGGTVLESYPAFLVATGTGASRDLLRQAGFQMDDVPDSGFVRLAGGDVRAADLRATGRPWSTDGDGRATAIVHFHAPVKEAWREDLESRGADVMRYLPRDAFLVRAPPPVLDGLSSLRHVDAVGAYEPGWKIRPALADRAGIVDVRIVVLPGQSPGRIVAWLGDHGVAPGPRRGTDPGIVGTFGPDDFRWVRARVPAALGEGLAALPSVEFIDAVGTPRLANAQTAWVLQSNVDSDYRYWTQGLDGRGQFVGISDTGADYDHVQLRESSGTIATGDLYNTTDASRRKVVRYVNMGVFTGLVDWSGISAPWDPASMMDSDHAPTGSDCTFGHGTAVASTFVGNDDGLPGGTANDGVAKGAKLVVEDIGTVGPGGLCSGNGDVLDYIPEDLADLFGPAGLVYEDPAAPVRIHSNSWGTDVNEYDVQARMLDAFVWSHPDLAVFFAAGNAGPTAGTVGSPGTAKNVVTVGGAGNPDTSAGGDQNSVAALSSRGPTPDGRIKPTLLAIFDGDSGMSDGDAGSGAGLGDDHWQGTSYATPAAAGAAAIVRQYLADGWYPSAAAVPGNARNPTAALLRGILIASGVQVTGSGSTETGNDRWPNNAQGFGRILLSNVLPLAGVDAFRTHLVDEASGLLTGEQSTYAFRVTSSARTLKIVLAWSDYPAALGAAKALVNDLDLEVRAPDGTLYRGNVFGTFANGQSVPGGTFDATNVEEAVILKAPMAGEWSVRVIGSDVPAGPQPFALVVTGNLDAAYGRVALDRGVYSESDVVRIGVEDADAGSVQVRVASGFEAAGETLTLTGSASAGTWRGSIPTSFGPALVDGVLQVRDGDVITVTYDDASPVHAATARARVDAAGPAISEVAADRPGTRSATIRWRTSEPATSGARYGTSPAALDGSGDLAELRLQHELRITGLQPDTLYYFDVVSRDRHGHETRDAAGGNHYRLRTSAAGDVLVVFGDETFPEEREASYEAALDARGWTWSAWHTAADGPPPLSLLQGHRAVVWQPGLEQYPPFNETERALVKTYLDAGGRLLVSSHDTAWALGDLTSGFSTLETRAWLNGVMKADLLCDPMTVGSLVGVAGDPIGGPFAAGVPYAPHREGGAVDQLTALATGGTAIWRDAQTTECTPTNRPVGLRWVSSNSNGTLGTGAWGGTPSRLVYLAFELTGLDASATDIRVGSATRADALDAALRWLVSTNSSSLDRDHPDVQVTAPNGGTFAGSRVSINWTVASTGAALASFDVLVSGDGGQTWTLLASPAAGARSHLWDLAGWPNGAEYLARVVGRDAGTPSLAGQDDSDAPFALARPGGDLVGPRIWAGSVRVDPNPPGAASPVRINATGDDAGTGSGTIAEAELFFAAAEPLPADAGTGIPLDAADGAFDGTQEALTWSGSLAAAPGASCVWTHARDDGGTWGPYESLCFVVISAGPDVTPPAPARSVAGGLVNGAADVEVTWEKAWDDSLFGGTTGYRVLRARTPRGSAVDVSGTILATRAASYAFLDPGTGAADPFDYFYFVETIDGTGNGARSGGLLAKARIPVAVGTNLLGIPVAAADGSLAALAAGLPWADAWAFDGCARAWTSSLPAEAASLVLGAGQGLWLNATAAGDLLVVGAVPGIASLDLCAGWNLVALPGFAAGVTVGQLKSATGATAVEGFDPLGPFHLRALADEELLAAGEGVWVKVPVRTRWSVAGW